MLNHDQSLRIRYWQPWLFSTGAKTEAGKNRSKMNALKHGRYTKANRDRRKLEAALRKLPVELQLKLLEMHAQQKK